MVKRIILWKIKDDQNKQANLNLLREGLLALATKVGDIVSVEVGLNFSSADYDIIFIVAFADPFQLKQFQTNPEYLKIFQQAQGISTNMIFCDYMAETSATVSNAPNTSHAPKGLIGSNTGALPKGIMSSNTNALPNLNNPNNQQPNNIGGSGMFGSTPKPNSSDGTKAFSPINTKNALPFAGREYGDPNNNQQSPAQANGFNGFNQPNNGFGSNNDNGFNRNEPNNGFNNNQYNGFGSNNANKGGVNFTVSENVNMRFTGDKPEEINTNDGTWKCSKCGKTNSSFINMCSCGRKKPIDNLGGMNMGGRMPMGGGMQPPNGQGGNPNSMLLNSSLLPKIPSMPKSNIPSSNGAWLCPSCGKSNNEFMKVCVCGHRKVERNGMNNGPGDFNNNNSSPMGFGGSNINMPKNPSMGANNIKSPNNNDFFNSFGGGMNKQNGPGGPMNKPGGPGDIGGMNSPINKPGGPGMGGMNGPGGPMNKPGGPGMGGMNGPGGPMNKPGGPGMGGMNGPGGPMKGPGMGGMNGPGGPMNGPGGRMPGPNMSRMPLGATGPISPPNKNMGGGGLGPNNLPPDSWKCPRCGKVLGNFVGQCVCGQRKPTRPMGGPNMGPMGPAGPGPNNSHMRF